MAGADKMGLSRIVQIAVTVSDLEKSLTFYRDVLGMRFLFQAPNVVFFDCDGVRLMLGLGGANTDAAARQGTIVYFMAADIRSTYAALVQRGAPAEREPSVIARLGSVDVWLGFVRDLDDNLIGLMEEVPA